MEQYLEFTANHTLLVAALVFSVFFLIFSELQRKARGLTDVGPTEAVKLINNDATVLDLRSVEAFNQGHIVNARNVPIDEISAKRSTLEGLKGKPVIAVCDTGVSSAKAVSTLRSEGFEQTYNLRGGLTAWRQENLPLVTAKKSKKKS